MGTPEVPAAVLAEARAWLANDPDPITRTALHTLLEGLPATSAELLAAFDGRLQFGTAGLRGPMGPGPMRMNVVMVRRTAAGLAAHLTTTRVAADEPVPVDVVVGYDGRHRSADFAQDAARVLVGAGLRVEVLPRALPTPLLAYAVRTRGARAGVMITASHNPPEDNGVKVYLGDGAQIVPPADVEISAAIDAVGPLAEVALAEPDDPRLVVLGPEVVDDYVAAVVARSHAPEARQVRTAYTPMHGVGGDVALAAFERAGFPAPAVVAAQATPDPDFPTVRFPNPEEPGAMDLLVDEARRAGADLAIANDPDADRLAVAIPDPHGPGARDGWRVLRGDEVGWLLAEHVLSHTMGHDRVVACSLVSSTLLVRMAAEAGVRCVVTLTGFKWIARAADDVPAGRFVFGYEEALGYAVHDLVRDKDGISAALAIAEVAALALADGTDMAGRLAELEVRYGAVLTGQLSPRFDGPDGAARMAAVMAVARRAPGQLAGLPVTSVEDLAEADPPADVVVVHLGADARVIVRPSGTEPKGKVYLEVVGRERASAEARMDALRADVAAWLGI